MAWNRRGKVLGMIMCNLRAALAAYQQAVELLPADAPQLLRVEILLGAAWCESVAGTRRAVPRCWTRQPRWSPTLMTRSWRKWPTPR